MAELKTKENESNVLDFINSVEHNTRRADALVLLDMFSTLTKEKPRMWGDSIIGFGKIHYKYATGREGDWMASGFSPRKQNLSLYILSDFEGRQALFNKLGKHKCGVGCLYINKLEDVDLEVLKQIISLSHARAAETNTFC